MLHASQTDVWAGLKQFKEANLGHFTLLLGTCLLCLFVKAIFFSALSKVPGPWYSKISGFPMMYQAMKGRRAVWVHHQFQRYGSLVAIAPNKVAVNSLEAMKVIYGTPWERADFYSHLEIAKNMHLLGVRDSREASKRRRAIMPSFSNEKLRQNGTPLIHAYLAKFTEQIDKCQQQDGKVDILRWYRLLAFDIVAQQDIAFDHRFKMLESGKASEIVALVHAGITFSVAKSLMPLVEPLAKLLGTSSARKWANSQEELAKFGGDLYKRWLKKSVEQRHSEVLNNLHQHFCSSTDNEAIQARKVASESSALLIAGSDTTSMTLVYMTYILSRDERLQRILQEELDGAISDPNQMPFLDELDALPYLNAIIKETLRLYPAVPGELPRLVPKGGAVVEGVYLPANTTIHCQPYSINRLTSIFGKDAAEFRPERYFNETPAMKAASFSFSYGPRICAGMNLAYAEMKIIAAHTFRKYHVTLAPETTPEAMEPFESFFTAPKTLRCQVVLQARQ